MRIEETLCLVPQRFFLLAAEICDLLYRRGSVFAFAADEDRFQEFLHYIRAAF